MSMSPAQQGQRLDALRAAGSTWVRFDMSWDLVQPDGPNTWRWEAFDQLVREASARQLKSLAILNYTPTWARPAGCTSVRCAPASADRFGQFVYNAVDRYSGAGIDAWEIWNEPNLVSSWVPRPDPDAYRALLGVAADAAHAADPEATVLVGGLGPTYSDGTDIAPTEFLARIYALGGGQDFDAMAMHPYSYPALSTDDLDWTGWTQMIAVRDLMAANGDGDKPIWVTEFGAPTRGDGAMATTDDRKYAEHPDHVDEALQALIAAAGLRQAFGTPWIAGVFWYGYQDLGTSASDSEQAFGIVRPDGSRKPAFDEVVSGFADASGA